MFTTISIILMTMGTVTTTTFTPVNHSSGIQFEELKEVQLSYAEYKICYFIELEALYTQNEKFNNYSMELHHICSNKIADSQTTEAEICHLALGELYIASQSIHRKMEAIYSFQHILKRSRRAPLEIIGTLSHAIFGLMSQKEADEFNQQINRLKADNKYQKELLKKNLIIADNTVHVMNSTFADLGDRMKKLNNELVNNIDATKTQINLLQWKTQFNTLSNSAILLLREHDRCIGEILKLLSHTLKGEISELVPLAQLRFNLQIIREHLGENEELPIKLESENLYNVLKVSAIHSILTNDRLLVEVTIPTVKSTNYKLIQTIPIPIYSRNALRVIIPSSNMFLTNPDRNEYIPLKEEEYTDCRGADDTRIICKQYEPILYGEKNVCELEILTNPMLMDIPELCNTREIPTNNYFIHLHEMNSYFCTIARPIGIQSICGNLHNNINLNTSGILRVDPGCYVKGSNFILRGHSTISTLPQRIVIPQSKINSIPKITDFNPLTVPADAIFIKDYREEFEDLAQKIQNAKNFEHLENMTNRVAGNTLGFSFSYFTLISILAILAITYKIKKNKKRGREQRFDIPEYKPNPKPRSKPTFIEIEMNESSEENQI